MSDGSLLKILMPE